MMFGWDDDHRFVIESSGVVPWLIWIQLLIFLLLILLFTYFGFLAIHLSASAHSPTTTAPSFSSVVATGHTAISRRHRSFQGEGDECIAGQRMMNASNGTAKDGNFTEGDGSTYSLDDSRSLEYLYHPCHYLELATRAFLGCLGLASSPRNPSPQDTEEDVND